MRNYMHFMGYRKRLSQFIYLNNFTWHENNDGGFSSEPQELLQEYPPEQQYGNQQVSILESITSLYISMKQRILPQ